MRHLDEGTIHGWLDGALSPEEAARVEAHVANCIACAEAVAEARGLVAASSRILTALDDVANVKGARGARGAGSRPFLVTWLVRERIAAVLALIVVGGALAVMVSRDAPEALQVQMASRQVTPVELAVAESSAPPPVAPQAEKDGQTLGRVGGGGAPQASLSRARDLSVALQPDSAPVSQQLHLGEAVTTEAVAAAPARTDDTVRSIVLAQAEREEAQGRPAEGKSSIGEKLAGALPRRQAADAAVRFGEPRAAAPGYAGALSAAAVVANQRLVHEERMTEGGREVLRRIYRIDGILVTLDERLPGALDEMRRARVEANAAPVVPAPAVPAAPVDSAPESTNTIRWTDARGAELTLTGAASPERLERFRKLLGY
jgi:hypothetical protein